MSKLHNVRGRITYISSHAKQENLYAVYETTDRHYWTELARFNQQEFLKSGTEVILSILVDTFISKISLPMQPVPEIGSISGACSSEEAHR